ncbi:MAG: hypothetical protein ACXAD7_21955, partial [Candidatus Kariarchaeaceae archaeon]
MFRKRYVNSDVINTLSTGLIFGLFGSLRSNEYIEDIFSSFEEIAQRIGGITSTVVHNIEQIVIGKEIRDMAFIVLEWHIDKGLV